MGGDICKDGVSQETAFRCPTQRAVWVVRCESTRSDYTNGIALSVPVTGGKTNRENCSEGNSSEFKHSGPAARLSLS